MALDKKFFEEIFNIIINIVFFSHYLLVEVKK